MIHMVIRRIEISREIEVDECLAEEIGELNNIYGIVTLACCCGHGDEKEAYIAVDDNMQGLYENTTFDKWMINGKEMKIDKIGQYIIFYPLEGEFSGKQHYIPLSNIHIIREIQ